MKGRHVLIPLPNWNNLQTFFVFMQYFLRNQNLESMRRTAIFGCAVQSCHSIFGPARAGAIQRPHRKFAKKVAGFRPPPLPALGAAVPD